MIYTVVSCDHSLSIYLDGYIDLNCITDEKLSIFC